MFYKFSFRTLKIMSEVKYSDISTHRDMMSRYFEEQDVNLKKSIFLPEEYKKIKDNTFLTSFNIGYKTQAYICVNSQLDFFYFVKDMKGFRFDISEEEFKNFILRYSDALSSLRDKINNGMYLEKFILNERSRNTILQLLDMEQEIKYADMDYDDYEYVVQ